MKKAKRGGKAIKLSHEVIEMLETKALEGESYDSVLRKMLKLPKRTKKQLKFKTLYILSRPNPAIFNDLASARGESMVRARMLKKLKGEKPTKVKVKIQNSKEK